MTVREVDVKKGTRIVLEGDAEADCKRACFWWINVQVSSSVALKEQAYKEMSHLPFVLLFAVTMARKAWSQMGSLR